MTVPNQVAGIAWLQRFWWHIEIVTPRRRENLRAVADDRYEETTEKLLDLARGLLDEARGTPP